MNGFLLLLILVCQLIQITANQRPKIQKQISKEYVLHSDKIDLYFQRIALMSVLKAKARRIIKTSVVDRIDELLYLRCANDAKTPVILAQCVIRLMKARDSKQELANRQPEDPWKTDWFRELRKLLWPSADSKTPLSFPDSSQSAPIFSPNLDPNKQKLVKNLHNQIHKIKDQPKQHPLKYLPIQQLPKRSRESPMKRRFYSSKEEEDEPGKLPMKSSKQFADFLQRRDLFSARSKRQAPKNETTQFPNIQNLRLIQTFFSQSQFCQNYLRRLQQNNQRYLRKFTNSIKYDYRQENLVSGIAGELNKIFNTNTFEKFSLLSPKILSLMPDNGQKSGILSHSILGFHQGGILSMPELLRIAASDDRDMLEWLELLMQMSGTGKHLDQLMTKIKEDVNQVEEVYPKLLQMRRWENQWSRLLNKQNRRQVEDLKRNGYTFINNLQAKRIYGSEKVPSYTQMSPSQQERQLEEWIEKIAKLDPAQFESKERRRRQATTPAAPILPPNSGEPPDPNRPPHLGEDDTIIFFEPYVFLNQINEHVLLDGLIMSPHAFVNELVLAETLPFDILTPRAFVATTLSAQALVSRVLSPAAFRSEIVSITFIEAMVLSPEALISYVLSPRILEARIGSPETLVFMVLSPGIINPRIHSGESYALLILSIESPEQFMIEILSPHIFGGSHETHHEGDVGIAEDHAAGAEVHSQSQPHRSNDDGTHIERPLESVVGAAPHRTIREAVI